MYKCCLHNMYVDTNQVSLTHHNLTVYYDYTLPKPNTSKKHKKIRINSTGITFADYVFSN